MAPVALTVVLVMRVAAPFIQFRVFQVYKHRIGHLALETELAALDSKYNSQKDKRTVTIFYFPDIAPANFQLNNMYRRKLISVFGNWGWLLNELSKLFKNMNISSQRTTIDFNGLLLKSKPILEFTSEESKHSDIKLLNLEPDQKFVCLHVRDNAFFSKTLGIQNHQTLRNTNIKTYLKAAEVLANLGYTVFRTGAVVQETLTSTNPRIIDYATNGMRTDFLDIYLAHNATFVVSTASGWDSVPTIFRRPILKVNVIPVFQIDCLGFSHLIVPKILCDSRSKEPLSIGEIINREIESVLDAEMYKNVGVEIRDLSSEELVEAVREMAQRVAGTFVETAEQKEMQAKLKHILSTHPKLQPSPNHYPIRAQFASCFLSRYPNFLD